MNNQGVEGKKAQQPKYSYRLKSEHLIMLLLCAALVTSLGFAWYQRRAAAQLTSSRDQLTASLSQTKAEVDAMSAQLKALAAAQRSSEPAPSPVVPAVKKPPKTAHRNVTQRAAVSRQPADDPRWKKIDSDLAKTRADLESSMKSNRDELEGRLKSSHDELNDSIAKTHEELVALAQKGERNYFEFDLSKSKEFERVGPIGISLRKADTKHKYCDLEVRVDDNQLSKKHLNLYEPVFFYPGGYSQPIEMVINRIDKNHIKGYVSKPKYGQAQVASAGADRNESASPSVTAPDKKQAPVLITHP